MAEVKEASCDRDAERMILGQAMLEPQYVVPQLVDHLTPRDLYYRTHKLILEAIYELYERNRPVDLISVGSRLEEKGLLAEVGGRSYLSQLLGSVATTTSCGYYAEIVKRQAKLRDLVRVGQEIAELAQSGADEVEEVFVKAEDALHDVTRGKVKRIYALADVAHQRWEELEHLYETGERIGTISLGYPDLDKKLNGLRSGDLMTIAGATSMGKTALTLEITRRVAKRGTPVAIFSLEMQGEEIFDRMLANEARVDLHSLASKGLSEADRKRSEKTKDFLAGLPIYIVYKPELTVLEFQADAQRLCREHDVGLLVLDFIQQIHPSSGNERDNEALRISRAANKLKATALALEVPVIMCSQISRQTERRRSRRPRLSDLKESSGIEQASNAVLLLHRDSYYDRDEGKSDDRPSVTEVNIAKNRNGPTGTVSLMFQPAFAAFDSYLPFEPDAKGVGEEERESQDGNWNGEAPF